MFACNRILFSHDSPRRGESFVTRKTPRGVAGCLKTGTRLRLGSLDPRRDCSHAHGYVEAIWLMLPQPTPSDYVIGTGISRSARDMVELAFGLVGLDWRDPVEFDPAYIRPTDVPQLLADLSKANHELGSYPPTSFEAMIRDMLESDLPAVGLHPGQSIVGAPTTQTGAPSS